MSLCTHEHHTQGLRTNATFKQDPTRTTTLRQRFMGEAGRRFRKLKGLIREVIVEEDGFGLTGPTVNRRFDFPRDATKVEAFMEWLRQAQRDEILEVRPGVPMERAGQQAWTSTYIRSAYKKGMSSAAQQMRGQGVEVSDRWLDAAFNRPIHADRVGLIYTRAYSQLEGITEAMDQQISRELAQGLAEGKNPLEIARRLNNRVDKVGRTRARTLARTEVISAHADATLNSYEEAGVEGVEVEAEWSTAGDSRVCDLCRPMEGQVFELEEARGMIPRHPNCLPGDSLVTASSGVTAASKRWFEGDMVIITTASGRKLTCTPNHPILTEAGWQAAKSINLSDNVISDSSIDWPSVAGGNNENVPTPIHEIAESFGSARGVFAMPVPVSAPDFHGDGIAGDIAQVWTNRKLATELDAAISEKIRQLIFMMADVKSRIASSLCPLDFFLFANVATTGGVMSRSDLSSALFRGHLGPLDSFGFGLSAQTDTSINKAGINSAAADAKLARQIISGATGPVFRDKVVNIDIQRFSGHVYNLESGNHSYIAQGIVNHNCRCTYIPVVKDPQGAALT